MAAGDWTADWKALKKDFTAKTGKKKPKASVTNIIGKSNLSPTLKKCDQAYLTATDIKLSAKKQEAGLKDLRSNAVKFKKLADSYIKDVQKAMVDAGKDKALMSELDVLRKKLDAIQATMNSKISGIDANLKQMNVWEKMARDMRVDLTAALKRGLLFAAKVKASPTHEVWNADIKNAARDITQQIGNVEKIRAKGHQIEGIPQKNATALFKAMTPWASDVVRFKADTPPQEILAERAKYLKCVQAVAKWMNS